MINLKIQNEGLLLKHLHKFYNHHDTPWVTLIWQSYYIGSIPHYSNKIGSFWWKDISALAIIYRGVIAVSVGDGAFTLFWKDLWTDKLLAEAYPRAFSYAINEDASVQDMLTAFDPAAIFYMPLSVQARNEVRQI